MGQQRNRGAPARACHGAVHTQRAALGCGCAAAAACCLARARGDAACHAHPGPPAGVVRVAQWRTAKRPGLRRPRRHHSDPSWLAQFGHPGDDHFHHLGLAWAPTAPARDHRPCRIPVWCAADSGARRPGRVAAPGFWCGRSDDPGRHGELVPLHHQVEG